MELTIKDIVAILMRKLGVIILCGLSFALGSFLISKYFVQPTYQSSLSLYVFNGDRNTDQTLYIAVLNTDNFLNSIINDLKLDCTVVQLRKALTVTAIKDTELFKITVQTTDPTVSMYIAKSIGKLAPSALATIVQTGRTEIVDIPVMATNPSSPNVPINTAIALLIGLFGSVMVVILMDTLDTRVRNVDDIVSKYDIPVLGTAPKRELIGGVKDGNKK